jgi:glycosyltransferase involved in cell wall biosynthesis
MRILMFSINPLFPGTVMGGAPKHLQSIATYLGEGGHDVTVLCTRAPNSDGDFHWGERVLVRPILPFKQPFPQPYAVTGYQLASIVQLVAEHLRDADRFYMHDGEFLFPYVYADVPTVVSLRDNVYPETLHGGFLFAGHRLVLISDYSRRFFLATAGRFFPELAERVTVIPNGLDWAHFRPTPPRDILDIVPVDPAHDTVILHPHRPEESKGILQTLAVIDLLVHRHGLTTVKALIPRWLAEQATPELREFYARVEAEIAARGLSAHIALHDWIPQHLMPEYYSLGAVTLSLGHFPESFGNAVYESLGCGVPSIAARVSTHRELLPDALLDKVDFGDAEAAADCAFEIIRSRRRTSPETLAYLRTHYSVERQRAAYAEVILNAQVAPPPAYVAPVIDDSTPYALAPWCYLSPTRGVYHDFRADYAAPDGLNALLSAYPNGGLTSAETLAAGMSAADFARCCDDGYLVPLV